MRHIIVDLEMNGISETYKSQAGYRHEVIEIGAVMLDDSFEEISEFKAYVKPEYNDDIEERITELTGITSKMVENEPHFCEILRSFIDWCLEAGDDIKMYAWSDSDYTQIKRELAAKNFQISDRDKLIVATKWTDLQKMVDRKIGVKKQLALDTAIGLSGLEFIGTQHDALNDARNTAILLKAVNDDELYSRTLYKIEKMFKGERLTTSLGSMFDFSSIMNK